jgi:hypothetical protein
MEKKTTRQNKKKKTARKDLKKRSQKKEHRLPLWKPKQKPQNTQFDLPFFRPVNLFEGFFRSLRVYLVVGPSCTFQYCRQNEYRHWSVLGNVHERTAPYGSWDQGKQDLDFVVGRDGSSFVLPTLSFFFFTLVLFVFVVLDCDLAVLVASLFHTMLTAGLASLEMWLTNKKYGTKKYVLAVNCGVIASRVALLWWFLDVVFGLFLFGCFDCHFQEITSKVKELLVYESNVVHLKAPCTVVGDIHG